MLFYSPSSLKLMEKTKEGKMLKIPKSTKNDLENRKVTNKTVWTIVFKGESSLWIKRISGRAGVVVSPVIG